MKTPSHVQDNEIRKKLRAVYRTLFRAYGPQHWWPADSRFEVIVGAILTQNTNWRNVERALANLKAAHALSPETLHRMPHPRLARLIQPSGFFNQKATRLKQFVSFLKKKYNSIDALCAEPLPGLRTTLLALPGIGPETADSIVLYAAEQPVFVIDAYTQRLLTRIGLPQSNYHAAQTLFEQALSKNVHLFQEYHALIVQLAKQHCKKKPVCNGCPLRTRLCRYQEET